MTTLIATTICLSSAFIAWLWTRGYFSFVVRDLAADIADYQSANDDLKQQVADAQTNVAEIELDYALRARKQRRLSKSEPAKRGWETRRAKAAGDATIAPASLQTVAKGK